MHKLGKYLRASSPASCFLGDSDANKSAFTQQNTFRGCNDKLQNLVFWVPSTTEPNRSLFFPIDLWEQTCPGAVEIPSNGSIITWEYDDQNWWYSCSLSDPMYVITESQFYISDFMCPRKLTGENLCSSRLPVTRGTSGPVALEFSSKFCIWKVFSPNSLMKTILTHTSLFPAS